MLELRITMNETVRVARREYTQGVTYTSGSRQERKLFEELVLNDYADVTHPEHTQNGSEFDPTTKRRGKPMPKYPAIQRINCKKTHTHAINRAGTKAKRYIEGENYTAESDGEALAFGHMVAMGWADDATKKAEDDTAGDTTDGSGVNSGESGEDQGDPAPNPDNQDPEPEPEPDRPADDPVEKLAIQLYLDEVYAPESGATAEDWGELLPGDREDFRDRARKQLQTKETTGGTKRKKDMGAAPENKSTE